MRIRKITINSYKNLKGVYSFENSDNYIALIGLNGSGKSNLLEAVSIIFYKLFSKKGKEIPFDYSVEYEVDNDVFNIGKKNFLKNGIQCKTKDIIYPSSIIACYSGEDKRLWSLAYEDYHYSYFREAVKESRFNPSLLYIDKSCWGIAFLSLICSEDPNVKSFLKDKLHVTSPADIEINFTIDDTKRTAFKLHSALSWFDRICRDNGETEVNGNLLSSTDPILTDKIDPDIEKAKTVFSFLYLLSQPEKKAKKNNIQRFITDIKIKVNGIFFDDLSEGEKKLILIECITKVLGDKKSLLLLDEPDAHTHIAMKKDLLKLISEFEGQTIMTTHSPMFVKMVQDDNPENLFYIENGCITVSQNNLIRKLSNDTLTVLDGTLYSKTNSYLLVEGKSDVNCIKAAINRFPEFNKLQDISIISFNGASEAKVFFEQAFIESMECIKKVVFLFDYDQDGLKEWKNLGEIISVYPDKCKRLFYQKEYVEELSPTSIIPSDSVLLEDLVQPSAYQQELDKIHAISSFHQLHAGGKISEKPIKDRIEGHCHEFTQDQLRDFKPLLTKLLSVFEIDWI